MNRISITSAVGFGFNNRSLWCRARTLFRLPAAKAASAPQVVSFDRVINGKLDVFSPGVSYKLITTQNGADFAATQITSIKRHAHYHSTEFLYVVSGTGTVTLGSQRRHIGPGDMISIPMGTPHAFKANGPPLRFVEVDVPSIAANDIHWLP